jgi:hypothetical protein
MAKATKTKKAIMTRGQERYMAFDGLIQWTQAVVTQSARVSEARDRQSAALSITSEPMQRRQDILAFHTECHFFVIAAHKLLEYRDWALTFALFASVDFGEIDSFSARHIGDLRDMRTHIIDYFSGRRHEPDRWVEKTSDSNTDASGVTLTMIGGRLDWIAFGAAAERLLPRLLEEPVPAVSNAP